jgi:RNA polymerase sigma-70 factor (ECF subfamily)
MPPDDLDQPTAIAEDLFRRESARLVAALTRLLGPANLSLAEDVVQDALVSALQAWRFGMPSDPTAWLLKAAKNRAIDLIRKNRKLVAFPLESDTASEAALVTSVEAALSDVQDATNQLAMMFSCCPDELSEDTHVTLILRFLCGLGPREIALAFLVGAATIDRRLHRGREALAAHGRLVDVSAPDDVRARLPSVLRALYLLFNEGYHGSDADNPLRGSMCFEALRLALLLLSAEPTALPEVCALAALFSFNAARLSTRLDVEGIFVPLAEQDRKRWNRELIEQGIVLLGSAAEGSEVSRWHLEAGIACEHALAASVEATSWARILELYDQLLARFPGPVVALNRALALAELHGPIAGRAALDAIGDDRRLVSYPFYWAARADLERRSANLAAAAHCYSRAIELSRSRAERVAYERRLRSLKQSLH